MYAIMNVIYGYHVDEKMSDKLEEFIGHDDVGTWLEDNGWGGETYSGSGSDYPRWIGARMCEFDECQITYLSKLRFEPTEEEKAKVEEARAALREILGESPPRVFILPSTS